MKLTVEEYVVLIEDENAIPEDRRWAQSHLVGDLIALQTGEGSTIGRIAWMDADEAIAFADALKAQAQQINAWKD